MKRERIFTRLHTVKLRLLSNKAMKISEAVLLMILAVSIVLSAFAVTNGQSGADGKSSTAGFISGLYKSVPPLTDLFDMAGMKLPEYLGKPAAEAEKSEHPAEKAE